MRRLWVPRRVAPEGGCVPSPWNPLLPSFLLAALFLPSSYSAAFALSRSFMGLFSDKALGPPQTSRETLPASPAVLARKTRRRVHPWSAVLGRQDREGHGLFACILCKLARGKFDVGRLRLGWGPRTL